MFVYRKRLDERQVDLFVCSGMKNEYIIYANNATVQMAESNWLYVRIVWLAH